MTPAHIMEALAAHFPPEAISWRVGPKSGTKTKPLAYLDARDVASRLDDVLGADWQCEYVPMPNGTCCCRIGILIDGQWRWRSNGAGETDVEGEKGQYSAAFKRAAVMWKVGAYLYNTSAPWVETEDNGKAIAAGEFPKLEALLRRQAAPASSPPPPKETPRQEPKAAPVAAKPIDKAKAGLDKPQSGRVATNLIAKCTLRQAAVMKGSGDVATIKSDHEGWKEDARACWHEMVALDQRRVKSAREQLEKVIADADAAAVRIETRRRSGVSTVIDNAKRETEPFDSETGELPAEEAA